MSSSSQSSIDEDYEDDQLWTTSNLRLIDQDSRLTEQASNDLTDKDKGKGKEVAVDQSSTSMNKLERIQQLKDELKSLENVNSNSLNVLIKEDPTKVSDLDTTTKLMKAIQILTSSIPNDQSQQQSIQLRKPQHYQLLELLTSALVDITSGSASNSTYVTGPSYDLQNARAELELKLNSVNGVGISSIQSESRARIPIRKETLNLKSTKTDMNRDIGTIYAENTRLLILALQPPFLQSRTSALNSNNSSGIQESTMSSSKRSYINFIPAEILANIFVIARKECESREVAVHNEGVNNPQFDDFTGVLRPGSMARRKVDVNGNDLNGSKAAAQRWIHSLALVNKHFKATSLSIAYSNLHLRRRPQLIKLISILDNPQTSSYSDFIIEINAKVAIPTLEALDLNGARSVGGSSSGVSRNRRYNLGNAVGGWSSSSTHDAGSSRGANGNREIDQSHGALFGKIVGKAKNLLKLNLVIQGNAYSIPLGRNGSTDFLEPVVLSTISTISTLRNLNLGTSIDFEELELILLGSPALTHLRLEGVDSFDQRGGVNSTVNHSCKLKTLVIGDGNPRSFTTVTDIQLAWLLEPTVDTMKHLEITVMSLSANGLGGGWGIIVAVPTAPPFASGLIADIIVRMGKTLETLAFRDVQNGSNIAPSLNAAPHNNSFDYALRYCIQLKELSIELHLTGPQFLNSLISPSLESLLLFGTPTNISASDLANRLELGNQFKALERILFYGQFNNRGVGVVVPGAPQLGGQVGWNSKDVRLLKNTAASKGIICSFSA